MDRDAGSDDDVNDTDTWTQLMLVMMQVQPVQTYMDIWMQMRMIQTDTGIQRVDGDAIRDGDADRGYTCRSTATDLQTQVKVWTGYADTDSWMEEIQSRKCRPRWIWIFRLVYGACKLSHSVLSDAL